MRECMYCTVCGPVPLRRRSSLPVVARGVALTLTVPCCVLLCCAGADVLSLEEDVQVAIETCPVDCIHWVRDCSQGLHINVGSVRFWGLVPRGWACSVGR
jgi:hypothetical protein